MIRKYEIEGENGCIEFAETKDKKLVTIKVYTKTGDTLYLNKVQLEEFFDVRYRLDIEWPNVEDPEGEE